MYDALTKEGHKVFFARISLEDKLGQEYEPYIFSALSTAKIMLAVGTDYEYFNAVWVKNEWSRFLDMRKNNPEKTLIPCYADIDAYDLPREFKNLQAVNMGSLGYIQDLVRGIGKILRPVEEKPAAQQQQVVQQTIVQQGAGTNVENLLKCRQMALEDGDWSGAEDFFNRVLDENAEEPRAYLGLLMCDLKVKKSQELNYLAEPFDDNLNYRKAVRFGGEKFEKQLSTYNKNIRERNEETRLNNIYQKALSMLKNERTESKFIEAAELFWTIKYYKDSEQKIAECEEKRVECLYNNAQKRLTARKPKVISSKPTSCSKN